MKILGNSLLAAATLFSISSLALASDEKDYSGGDCKALYPSQINDISHWSFYIRNNATTPRYIGCPAPRDSAFYDTGPLVRLYVSNLGESTSCWIHNGKFIDINETSGGVRSWTSDTTTKNGNDILTLDMRNITVDIASSYGIVCRMAPGTTLWHYRIGEFTNTDNE